MEWVKVKKNKRGGDDGEVWWSEKGKGWMGRVE